MNWFRLLAAAICLLTCCCCCAIIVLCSWKVTRAQYDQIVAATKSFSDDSLQFMSKVLHRSGLGDETYAPPSEPDVEVSYIWCAATKQHDSSSCSLQH